MEEPTPGLRRGIAVIRVLLGLVIVLDSLYKLFGSRIPGFTYFPGIRFPSAGSITIIIAVLESLCAVAIIIGFRTKYVAALLLVFVVVALFNTQMPIIADTGFWAATPQGRLASYLLAGFLFLSIYGDGGLNSSTSVSKK